MLKKIIICLLFPALAMPAMADNSSTTSASTNQDKNEGKGGDTADKGEAETTKTGGKSGKDENAAEEKKNPNVFECQYYTVTLSLAGQLLPRQRKIRERLLLFSSPTAAALR